MIHATERIDGGTDMRDMVLSALRDAEQVSSHTEIRGPAS